MSDWQPIETAPKLDVYLVANRSTGHVAVKIFGVIHNVPGDPLCDWQWGEAPTHWQPLPEPPK